MTTIAIHPFFAFRSAAVCLSKGHHGGKDHRRRAFRPVVFQLDDHHHQIPPTLDRAKTARKFFAAYGATRDPLDIKRKGESLPRRAGLSTLHPRRG
jgi:hypothetical protein